MRKILLSILALLLFVPSVAHAQVPADATSIMPVPPDRATNLFGQNHFYTVTLRGNGEAIVTFKAVLSNTESSPIETVSLILPENISPADIIAYQVIQEPQCIRYLPQPIYLDSKAPTTQRLPEEKCAEYQQPDYNYVYGNVKYERIANETQNNTILLRLPTPIEPNKNGSYFVYYRTNTIAQQDMFGAYDYKFVSLQTEDKIHSLQVGISTDADYILKGAQGDVNYGGVPAMASLKTADGLERAVSSAQFDQFYNQIGTGTLIKQASELAPKETYEVKGSYAQSQAKLYGKEIATGVGVFLLIVIVTIVVINIVLRKTSGKKTERTEEHVAQLKSRNKTFMVTLSISFVSILFLCLYTFAIYAITQLLNPNGYYGYSQNESLLMLVVLAVSALVYLFFFFAPAVGMGIKKGMGWALVTFAATVVWAVLFLLVLFVVLFFVTPKTQGYPPYMMSSFESKAAPAAAFDLPAPAVEPAVTTDDVLTPPDAAVAPQTLEAQPAEAGTLQVQPLKQEVVETKTVETKITQ